MSNSTFTQCPTCDQEVSARAVRCNYCGELLRDFRDCPHCAERVRLAAKVCRYCRNDLTPVIPVIGEPPGEQSATSQAARRRPEAAYLAAATPLGALFCNRSLTGLVLQPELFVTPTDLEFHSWSIFGLRSFDQKIPFSRVTSVRLVQGIFWASIIIETFGGPVSELELRGMNKREAQDLSELIDRFAHAPAERPATDSKRESA